jgi:tetratricopeptide (TPR) repeat protein
MSEQLAIANLLSLLQIDPHDNALQLCRDADSLRRRRRYAEAIDLAKQAVRMSRQNYAEMGVALLYLGSIRASAHRSADDTQAVRDCERAVRTLSIHPHNRVIAQIIRGQIELEIDEARQAAALVNFDQAYQSLEKLILTTREYNQKKYLPTYRSLETALMNRIGQLSTALGVVAPIEVADKEAIDQSTPLPIEIDQPTVQTRPGQATPAPIRLPVPTKLIWPISEPASIEMVTPIGGALLDAIEINELEIEGRHYKVNPIVPVSGSGGSLRLQHGMRYVTFQIDGANDQRVLVRSQNRLDQKRQFVVVTDPSQRAAWIDDAESTAPFKAVHIIGAERKWNLRDGSELTPLPENELRIIGVVEAILTPVAESIAA